MPDNVDIDTVTVSGMYRLATMELPWQAFSQMLVVHGGADTISQVIFAFSGGGVYVRTGNPMQVGGPGVWSDWKQLAVCTAPEVHDLPLASGVRNSQYSTSQYSKTQESVVTLNVWAIATLSVGTLIGTLPEGFRPRTNRACSIFVLTTKYGVYSPAEIVVQTDGKVYCYGSALDGSEFELGFSISFVASS